jgi:hypothetical protein
MTEFDGTQSSAADDKQIECILKVVSEIGDLKCFLVKYPKEELETYDKEEKILR